MSPNVLRQFLELYDKQGLGGPSQYNAQFDPYGVLDHANRMNGAAGDSARMMWAERMAGQGQQQQAPNFFANAQQAAYQQPEQFRYDPARDMPPQYQQQAQDPMMGRGPPRNFLARRAYG